MSGEAAPSPTGAGPDAASALGALNARTLARQRMLLVGGGSTAALALLWFVTGGHGDLRRAPDTSARIETGGIVNRDLSQKEFVAIYGNRLDAQARQLKALEENRAVAPEVQSKLDALAAENQAMKADGTKTIDALTQENTTLRDQLVRAQTSQAPVAQQPSPPNAISPSPAPDDGGGVVASPDAAPGSDSGRQVRIIAFTAAPNDAASKVGPRAARPTSPPIEVEDSPDYLPPNSYAPARVIVGVDASAGVASQADPLPVVLRITGPARSVIKDGALLTTRIEGCVVNGAARGDLSAEKVYVKLQKMTCDQPGGRVAVSEVKGFISFAGKTGVRGRVVSREGSLVGQALLAGVVGGFGRGFAANASSIFSGYAGGGVAGARQSLSGGDIVRGGLGQGAADASDTVSKYLIERAEQYQPVVEMPTGIDVEIVFLDGVYVRNGQ